MKAAKILLLIAMIGLFALNSLAQTWTQTGAPSNSWTYVASSADGSKLVAAASYYNHQNFLTNVPGSIYISTNWGQSWIQTSAPTDMWVSIACSADCTKLIAAAGPDGVYVSTNSGSNWSLTPLLRHQIFWNALAASADGTKLIAAADNGGVCISTNSGVNWTQTSLPASISNYWPRVTSSADGCTLAVVNDVNNVGLGEFVGGPIYISTNAGATWVPTAINEWHSLAMSPDGTKLVAASDNSIYVSTNSGNDWMSVNTPPSGWKIIGNIEVSSSGSTKLMAVSIIGGLLQFPPSSIFTNQIYISTDLGRSWSSFGPTWTNALSVVSTSTDESKLIAITIGSSGYIYTEQIISSPSINIAPTNGSLALSWLVPSTNFFLQCSADLSTWMDLTNQPVLNLTNLQNEVMLPLSNSNVFYRLKTP